MAIIASYFAGEAYGLLGPQMAATIIEDNAPYDCIVIAVAREDDKGLLKKALIDYFGQQRPVIGFSTLCGREDLFSFAKELKDEGAITILGGPQADVDYLGEKGWQDYPHRFQGLSANFTFSLHGPAEQIIHLLKHLDGGLQQDAPGLLYVRRDGALRQNPEKVWEEKFLEKVRWNNIYRVKEGGLVPLRIAAGQVLQQIGCPYAARQKWVKIDYPAFLTQKDARKVKLLVRGCSFCDVAVDKGFFGELDIETVMRQIRCLPETEDGSKIPFELINENPLPGLARLLGEIRDREIRVSQIDLILRADWFLRAAEMLREALRMARSMGIRILLAAVGFESFDDEILCNLNKGLSVETNLQAVHLMRQLKDEFPSEWGYSRVEGATHGFIHPTPWDTAQRWANIQEVLLQNHLLDDLLPDHSTPLIIHHASGLGDWIREVEGSEGVEFKRYGSIIGWWQGEGSTDSPPPEGPLGTSGFFP